MRRVHSDWNRGPGTQGAELRISLSIAIVPRKPLAPLTPGGVSTSGVSSSAASRAPTHLVHEGVVVAAELATIGHRHDRPLALVASLQCSPACTAWSRRARLRPVTFSVCCARSSSASACSGRRRSFSAASVAVARSCSAYDLALSLFAVHGLGPRSPRFPSKASRAAGAPLSVSCRATPHTTTASRMVGSRSCQVRSR